MAPTADDDMSISAKVSVNGQLTVHTNAEGPCSGVNVGQASIGTPSGLPKAHNLIAVANNAVKNVSIILEKTDSYTALVRNAASPQGSDMYSSKQHYLSSFNDAHAQCFFPSMRGYVAHER